MNTSTPAFSLHGKKGLILGIANEHSIAWGCAKLIREQGAAVVATCQSEKSRPFVKPLTGSSGMTGQTIYVDAGCHAVA